MTTRLELLVDAVIVRDDEVVDAWVAVADGLIVAVGERHETPPPADVRTSLGGAALLPGFIDVHVHGGGGDSFGADDDANRRAAAFHLRHGTTALLPTLVTAESATLLRAVDCLGRTREAEVGRARIVGAHLEGPFISPERRGAHDPALIRPPEVGEFEQLCRAGGGRVRHVTAAPELAGFTDLSKAAERAGVRVAAGHTNASGEQLLEAVRSGVVSLTHTFNAMRPIGQREPGVIQAITDTGVFCEVIADGIHVHPAMVRLLRAVAGADRVVLVTDSSEFAGRPDGDYVTPRRSVAVKDGAVRLAGTETLAGSTLTMLEAARNYVAFTGAGLAELATVTSRNAAVLLGEDHRLGRIRPGYAADLVVLDKSLECRGVMCGGSWTSGVAGADASFGAPAASADLSRGAYAV